MRHRLGFVVPRYGPHVLGGAETLVRNFAERLVQRGHSVTVMTTCMRTYADWVNVDPPGQTAEHGVTVLRAPVLDGWDVPRAAELWRRAASLTVDEQYEWVARLPQSPGLYRHLEAQAANLDVIFFAPYMYSTTLFGALVAPEKSVIWPCLHDEVFAYFHATRVVMTSGKGVVFNTRAEQRLAERLGIQHPRASVVGAGVDGDVRLSVQPPPIEGPYVMYAGRLEPSKNYDVLARYFANYKSEYGGDLKLVVSGTGVLGSIRHPDIVYLGFLERADMLAAMRHALVFCQPSVNESFSFVIMEAWLAGAPVLVHRHCAVTYEHVVASQGGLAFGDYQGFASALNELQAQPEARRTMGARGAAYVKREYRWDIVLDRFEQALGQWI